jgi:HEAT repeat protein
MKPDPADQAIEKLSAAAPDTPEGRKIFISALASRYNRVIARAAKILDNLRIADLCPQMADALTRLMSKGEASDKGCVAMLALARTLVNLDYDAPELYLQGMKYVQKEASWGPPVDTAVDLRATCAMGLANSLYPSKYNPLIELLVDAEWGARSGAVRALAALGTESAYILLRYKARIGDENPEVLSTCLEALLAGEGASALPLVTTIAATAGPETREAAILALGASRRDDAIAWLIRRCGEAVRENDRRPLYLALSSSRTEPALDFLLELLRASRSSIFALVNEALAIHGRDPQLRDRIEAAIRARSIGAD